MAILCFIVWYYPVGLYRNAEPTNEVHIRSFHTLLIIIATFLFASSLAHMLIAGSPNEEIAGAFATLLGIMLYAFCGILSGPDDLPGFWIFMYRVCLASFTFTFTFLLHTSPMIHGRFWMLISCATGQSFYIPRLIVHVYHSRSRPGLLRLN